MGAKDIAEKLLEDYNDVFADIVNTLLFDGKEIIKPNELENTKDRSQYKADDDELHEQERDVSKFWTKGKIKIALCGLENQTIIDKDMPLRVISYDGASYKSQLLDDNIKERYPVITLVLYFGTTKWNKSLNLHECLDEIPDEIKKYVNYYTINLFQIAFLSDEKVQMFKSDFGIIEDFFVLKRKNSEYIPSNKQIKYVDEFLKLMKALTGDKGYVQANAKGGVKTMCDVLQGAKDKAKAEGKAEGEALGLIKGEIKSMYTRNKMSAQEIADELNRPLKFVQEVINSLSI